MTVRQRLTRWLPERVQPLVSGAQFGQFVSVGAIGAVADTLVLAAATLLVGVSELWGKAAGIEVAVVLMFLLNERWTFTSYGSNGWRPLLARLGKSHLVRSGGVAIQLAFFWALTGPYAIQVAIGGLDVWFLLASLVSIGIATVINYVFEGLFTWDIDGTTSTANEKPSSAD
ncbi:GtrA family protein [Halonotius roseus]|uniref:GtrA family protein n=1 Tax=Halonotius roseus TaxID=2511997 RepID=A0A544QRL0_9EURY|nr:GtrA family protein [Halonotius roseus]TQQ82081.1 GtrA family protein [Halonotius roseus]